jgi:glycosyltransferase involved in cell wall biosynthesis
VRVVLAAAWYLPDSLGGTELYVQDLATGLRTEGIEVTVAVPVPREDERRLGPDVVDGVAVWRYPMDGDADVRLRLDREAAPGWKELLRARRPDVVDVHSLTSQVGLPQLRSARETGARTVTTLHLPGLICARGTLMRFGDVPCDGDLAVQPCTACRLQAQGVPSVVGHILSRLPAEVGRQVERTPVPRLLQRPFTAQLAHEQRRALLAAIVSASDTIVALSDWQAAMLVRNGVAPDKVRVCRQGVPARVAVGRPLDAAGSRRVLRIGYVGRYDEMKGLHVLVEAVLELGDAPVELHIWGVARTPEARAYRDAIRALAEGHPSIVFHAEVDGAAIYSGIDVLAVPSISFETGPIVVLEAHAAGVPVVGSDLGGIAERVRDGVDGVLVAPGDARAWSAVFRRFLDDRSSLVVLRPVHRVRTMQDAVGETLQTYRQVLQMVPA